MKKILIKTTPAWLALSALTLGLYGCATSSQQTQVSPPTLNNFKQDVQTLADNYIKTAMTNQTPAEKAPLSGMAISIKLGSLPTQTINSGDLSKTKNNLVMNDSLFRMGSLTKSYIAALISLLVCAFLLSFPLARQIKQLNIITQYYARGQLDAPSKMPKLGLLKPLYQSIHRMGASLSQLIRGQKDLIMTTAHELRTPLSRLRFELDTLKVTHPNIEQDLKSIEYDIDELEQLVNEFIRYGKIEWQHFNEAFSRFDLTAILKHIGSDTKRAWKDKTLKLILPEKPIELYAHKNLLKFAISNLLQNAFKYSHSTVELTVLDFPEQVELLIADDASPIEEKDYDKIFEPFMRLSNQQTGFGLGLMSVKKVADLHTGKISISQSSLGGNTFSLTIPKNNVT